jgi:hypothetical protein
MRVSQVSDSRLRDCQSALQRRAAGLHCCQSRWPPRRAEVVDVLQRAAGDFDADVHGLDETPRGFRVHSVTFAGASFQLEDEFGLDGRETPAKTPGVDHGGAIGALQAALEDRPTRRWAPYFSLMARESSRLSSRRSASSQSAMASSWQR